MVWQLRIGPERIQSAKPAYGLSPVKFAVGRVKGSINPPGRIPGIQRAPQPFANHLRLHWIPARGRDDKKLAVAMTIFVKTTP